MDGLPQFDLCDEGDPLVSAILGVRALADALAHALADDSEASASEGGPSRRLDELELAVLGLLSVRRTLQRLMTGLVDGAAAPSSAAPGRAESRPRPEELLR